MSRGKRKLRTTTLSSTKRPIYHSPFLKRRSSMCRLRWSQKGFNISQFKGNKGYDNYRQFVHYPEDYGLNTKRPEGIPPNFPGLQGVQSTTVKRQSSRSPSILLNQLTRGSVINVPRLPQNSFVVNKNVSKINPKSLASTGTAFNPKPSMK